MIDTVLEEKKHLRAEARDRRREAAAALAPAAGERLADNFLAAPGLKMPTGAVSGYWPMADEIDVRPLMTRHHELGRTVGLPVVVAKGAPLIFRAWRPGMALEAGGFGLHHPGSGAPEVTPGMLLVPLLAFDDRGTRLGWGGGYYDRTLRALRAQAPVVAVGVAFAAQRFERVPRTSTDEPLDWIVTEESALEIG
ncbi:MAG: 5-formyltetrahydrofolate cyclo-ligase [Rhodospirillales bacterium]